MTVNPDLFAEQEPRCDTCGLVLDKRHTLDECRDASAFRRKARASFDALDWSTEETDTSPETK